MTVVPVVVSESALCDLPDRIVVSPAYGRLSVPGPQHFTTEGEVVRCGDLVALIESREGTTEVMAPCDAWLLSYLARDGTRVEPGSPIVHLRAL